MTGDAGASPDPIRILEHTLIDICDRLDATFALDGSAVVFVRRSGGARQEWNAWLGDWLVADGPSWRVVPDGDFGRIRADVGQERCEPTPPPDPKPAPSRPGALAT